MLLSREEEGEWIEDKKLEGHSDWVRDVAWAPSIGLPKSIIASCSQVDTLLSSCNIEILYRSDWSENSF